MMLHEHAQGRALVAILRRSAERRPATGATTTARRSPTPPTGTRTSSTGTSRRRTGSSIRWRSSACRPRRSRPSDGRCAEGRTARAPRPRAAPRARRGARRPPRRRATRRPAGAQLACGGCYLDLLAPLTAVSHRRRVMNHKTRAILLFTLVACFTVLIFGGVKIDQHKPPIPERVVAPAGEVRPHRRRHQRRAAAVPLPRRPADRLGLGPRRVPRPRLVGRHAAPDGARHRRLAARPRRAAGTFPRPTSRRSPPASAAASRRRPAPSCAEPLRRGDRHADPLARPGRRLARPRRLLHAALRQGSTAMSIPARLRRGSRRTRAR